MPKINSFSIHAKSPEGFVVDIHADLNDGENMPDAISFVETILRSAGYEDTTSYASRSSSATSTQSVGDVSLGNPSGGARPVGFNTDFTFSAETLVTEFADGKTSHKVKGGRYQRWGVRIWPEALEAAGIDTAKLDPRQPLALTGYTARYVTTDSGSPRKVVELVGSGAQSGAAASSQQPATAAGDGGELPF